MKNDDALRKVLQEKIAIINSPQLPKSARKEIEKVMFEKFNVQSSRIIDIFNGFEPIESTPYHMLYKMAVAISEVGIQRGDFDCSGLNIGTYFYDEEIPEYSKPIPEEDNDIDVEFDRWEQVNVGAYSYIDIHSTIDYIYNKIYPYNKFRFNPEVQRDLLVVETDGIPIYKLDLNQESVKNMKKEMKDGTYFPVTGTIVINPELYDESPIQIKNGKLFIDRKFKIDLAEGFHNYVAYTQVKAENKDWQYPCDFRLYVMNVEDTQRYILQMDKKNHFKKEQTSRLDVSGNNYFINNLNTFGNFTLRGTINERMRLKLYDILPNIFDINDITDAAKLIRPVTENLNIVIMNTNHFDSPFTKEEWFIYLYLIKQSLDKKIDFNKIIDNIKIENLLQEIQFKNKPVSKHFKILNKIIEEVKNNV